MKCNFDLACNDQDDDEFDGDANSVRNGCDTSPVD